MTQMFIWAIFAYPNHVQTMSDARGDFQVAFRTQAGCERDLKYHKLEGFAFRCVKLPLGE